MKRHLRLSTLLLVIAVASLAYLYLVPLVYVLRTAFSEPSSIGFSDSAALTLASFKELATNPYYVKILGTTLIISLMVAVMTALIAYPLALAIVLFPERIGNLLLIFVVTPMLTSSIARTFGWVVILGPTGLISSTLRTLGVAQPPQLMGTTFGISLGLAQIYIPYATLIMSSAFGALNQNLSYAAQTLGASKMMTFKRIILPLTANGLFSSCMLVFVLSASAYVTPQVLGSGKVQTLATEIYDSAVVALNWPMASALAIVLIVLYAAIMIIVNVVKAHAERIRS